MSSISRRRNGLMALSVIGAPVLSEVQGPSISRQDACFPLLPRPLVSPITAGAVSSIDATLAPERAPAKVRNPSVDAPFQARENVGVVVARGRMLSSVRPLMRQGDSRRPVWEFADRV